MLTDAVALPDRPLDDAYSISGMRLEGTRTPMALHSLIYSADLNVKGVDRTLLGVSVYLGMPRGVWEVALSCYDGGNELVDLADKARLIGT